MNPNEGDRCHEDVLVNPSARPAKSGQRPISNPTARSVRASELERLLESILIPTANRWPLLATQHRFRSERAKLAWANRSAHSKARSLENLRPRVAQ